MSIKLWIYCPFATMLCFINNNQLSMFHHWLDIRPVK